MITLRQGKIYWDMKILWGFFGFTDYGFALKYAGATKGRTQIMFRPKSEYVSVDCPRCQFVLAIEWARWFVWHTVGGLYTCPRCKARFGD